MTEPIGQVERLRDARDVRNFRQLFGTLLRDARTAKGLTQSEVGDRVSVHRSVINRLENGERDAKMELAQALADLLDAPTLTEYATVSSRANTRFRPAAQRLEVLETLLSRPVDRLVIVAADHLEITKLLEDARLNLPPTVSIILPTRLRQKEMRGSSKRLDAVAGRWDVQTQINRIFEDASKLNPAIGIGAEVILYESDEITQSFVLVGTSEGTFCVYWPVLRHAVTEQQRRAIPAIVTQEPEAVAMAEDEVRELLVGQKPLTHLKAIVTNELLPDDGAASNRAHRLSGFFQLGMHDQAEVWGHSELGYSSGFAVALVLVHGYVEQLGRPADRRLILSKEDRTGLHELFSAHVSNVDFETENTSGRRSTSSHRVALDEFISRSDGALGHVPVEAFARAASRGVLDEFGVVVPQQAFVEISLPQPLWSVAKGAGHVPVVPRLFHLDLSPGPAQVGSESVPPDEWALWLKSCMALKHAFRADPRTEVYGWADMQPKGLSFNDFIVSAREHDDGWLIRKLNIDLKIAEH